MRVDDRAEGTDFFGLVGVGNADLEVRHIHVDHFDLGAAQRVAEGQHQGGIRRAATLDGQISRIDSRYPAEVPPCHGDRVHALGIGDVEHPGVEGAHVRLEAERVQRAADFGSISRVSVGRLVTGRQPGHRLVAFAGCVKDRTGGIGTGAGEMHRLTQGRRAGGLEKREQADNGQKGFQHETVSAWFGKSAKNM